LERRPEGDGEEEEEAWVLDGVTGHTDDTKRLSFRTCNLDNRRINNNNTWSFLQLAVESPGVSYDNNMYSAVQQHHIVSPREERTSEHPSRPPRLCARDIVGVFANCGKRRFLQERCRRRPPKVPRCARPARQREKHEVSGGFPSGRRDGRFFSQHGDLAEGRRGGAGRGGFAKLKLVGDERRDLHVLCCWHASIVMIISSSISLHVSSKQRGRAEQTRAEQTRPV